MNSFCQLESISYSLGAYKCLCLKGDDAQSFLNSQATSNILKLEDNQFHYSSLLDISARLESFFIVIKLNKNLFNLLIPQEIYEPTKLRLEKFHISEDVFFEDSPESFSIHFFKKTNGAKGFFGSLEAIINNEKHSLNLSDDIYDLLGVPVLGKTILLNELINNTLLFNLAVDLKKGCFLGQETVSKIETRRGAALAPVLLKTSEKLAKELPVKITSLGHPIGEVRSFFIFKSQNYYLAFLNRENRVSNKEIFIDVEDNKVLCTVSYYPLITLEQIVESFYQEAIIDFQSNQNDFAIKKLKRIIEVMPSYHDAYESLGVIYAREENFKEAIEVMHQLEFLNPKSVMAQTNLSMFYMKCGEIEKAEKHKSNATINQFETFGDEANKKRMLEEEQRKKTEDKLKRESMFKQVLAIDPHDALASFGLGELRLSERNFEEAISLLLVALKTDPKYSVAYLALAKAYLGAGSKNEALKILDKGIEVASKKGDLMPANEMQSLLVENFR